MYDPGGVGGAQLPGLSDSPWSDFSSNGSAAANLFFAGQLPPGWWKALSMPIAWPLAAGYAKDAYRNAQQLNGDHPTQINQQQWTSQVENALARILRSGGYK